jgi:hypothetical protein
MEEREQSFSNLNQEVYKMRSNFSHLEEEIQARDVQVTRLSN